MKKAFSRLITFINHLLAYLVSTLVERWLRKHVTSVRMISYTDSSTLELVGGSVTLIIDDTGNSIVIDTMEDLI